SGTSRCPRRTLPSSCASRRRSPRWTSPVPRWVLSPAASASSRRTTVADATCRNRCAEMDTDTVDDVLADFQGHLNLIFARARTMWRESAARMHPELQPAGYKLLAFIARTGPTSAHQLAERFEMDKSTV